MSLEKAFVELIHSGRELNQSLKMLGATVVSDRPRGDTVPLMVEQMGDQVEDVTGLDHELQQYLNRVHRAASSSRDVPAVRELLIRVQETFLQLQESFLVFTTPEAFRERHRLSERGGQWRAWLSVVEESALPTLQKSILAVHRSLAECWEELSECLVRTEDRTWTARPPLSLEPQPKRTHEREVLEQ